MGKGENEEANSMKKFQDYQEKCAKTNMQILYLDRMFINISLGYYMFFNLAPNIYIKVLNSTVKVLFPSSFRCTDLLSPLIFL